MASAVILAKKAEIHARKKHKSNTIAKAKASAPRLLVSRSSKHISAQVVALDGKSIAQVSDLKLKGTKSEKAFLVGKAVAELAKKAKVEAVVFDRNGYLYHGRVERLAAGAREAGLAF